MTESHKNVRFLKSTSRKKSHHLLSLPAPRTNLHHNNFHSHTPMKTPHMKSLAAMSLIALTVALSPQAKGVTLINYNFNSLTTGTSVGGQDGWTSTNNAQVLTTPVDVVGGTPGLSNGNTSSATFATKSFFSTNTLTSSDIVTLTFDAYQDSASSVAWFGIGYGSSAATFGIWNGTIAVREEWDGVSGAPIHQAKTSGNFDVTVNDDDWYSFQSVWNLSTRTATLYYKNLSAGDVNYTQLFFNQAQTQASVSIGTYSNVNTWTTAWLRVGTTATGTGYLDNLSAVAVPEPHTLALGLLGLGTFLAMRFRRRAS